MRSNRGWPCPPRRRSGSRRPGPAVPRPARVGAARPVARVRVGPRRRSAGPAARPAVSRRRRARRRPGRRPVRDPRVRSPYARRVASVRSGSAADGRRGAPTGAAGRRPAGRATDDLLVGGLDRQEPRQRRLAAGVGVIGLGQPAVGALDLVERGAARQPEDVVRIGVERHRRGPRTRPTSGHRPDPVSR